MERGTRFGEALDTLLGPEGSGDAVLGLLFAEWVWWCAGWFLLVVGPTEIAACCGGCGVPVVF